ncbi:hypothetical protein QBC38DRAFT_344862, partial [Podospora fimiseda]
LACPFLLFDELKNPACRNHRFRKIKEVKQHLRRQHAAKCVCPSCQCPFRSKKSLHAHKQDGCSAETRTPEWISEKTQQELRKYSRRGQSQEKQWFDVWKTVFPNRDPPASPFLKSEAEETLEALRKFWEESRAGILAEIDPSIPHHGTVGRKHEQVFDRLMQATLDRFEHEI